MCASTHGRRVAVHDLRRSWHRKTEGSSGHEVGTRQWPFSQSLPDVAVPRVRAPRGALRAPASGTTRQRGAFEVRGLVRGTMRGSGGSSPRAPDEPSESGFESLVEGCILGYDSLSLEGGPSNVSTRQQGRVRQITGLPGSTWQRNQGRGGRYQETLA